jgi:putative glutamine amidotransferase
MSIRVAIPEPTSFDTAYNQRSLPPYLSSLHSAGLTPIVIPLHESQHRIAKLLSTVQGIVLPGSGADIDPQKYGQSRIALCAEPDVPRSVVDELLIQDAFNLRKPILGICYGTQSLNVWCGGSLVQDVPTGVGIAVNHAPGRQVDKAHTVLVKPATRLAAIVVGALVDEEAAEPVVNSSHHQAIQILGNNLVISAWSPKDNVIEAVELDSPEHFVVAVQWHPERTYISSALSRAIFQAFANASELWTPHRMEESVQHA